MSKQNVYKILHNENGPDIGYSPDSGVSILEIDGLYFKDLNQNGKLDPYEDWRLPIEERIADLAMQMSVDEIAGLMLYSAHQSISSSDDVFTQMFSGTYDGKKIKESNKSITDLSDQQLKFLDEDNLRHVLITTVDSAKISAEWSNNAQAYVEGLGLGIPINVSTDPRHTPSADAEYAAGAGGDVSFWPEPLGLAATFKPDLVRKFGEVAGQEYRAMGITTALSPQVDLATDPRWMRFEGTFGEDTALTTDMTKAYIDGFQGVKGWNSNSVNAMVKHWPGGGSGEAGRDAHYRFGKYAVYPGNNFDEHLIPFTEGAFKLDGETNYASAVMPYYTISYDQDKKYGENVGNSYSKYIIQDLLRDKYGYEGVVCTDWMITQENKSYSSFMTGKCWGTEDLSEAERHYKILMSGVDQFGGNNDKKPVLEAYKMGVEEFGEEFMRNRFEQSAKRLLRNIFQTGLFENPYLDPSHTDRIVGNPEFMEAGYDAQKKSVVLLKNKNKCFPMRKGKKVYIPKRRVEEGVDWFGQVIEKHEIFPVNKELVDKYYTVVDTPEEADFSLVFINSPSSIAYSDEKGFKPLTLQYREYTAEYARDEAIANEEGESRAYKGKVNKPSNSQDLDIVLETKEAMGDKPVMVVMKTSNPTVVSEFEDKVEGLVLEFNVQTQAILDLVSGEDDFSACLPFQMPKNMKTVEEQFEDVAHDMEVYVDSEGNAYDFAFGLSYKGILENKYKK